MTKTAIRSSTTAIVVINTLAQDGILEPSMAIIPITKAISVAIGMAQPLTYSVPKLNAKYIIAGTVAPLNAAATGKIADLKEVRLPNFNSLLISRPTIKKNSAINPSFTQSCRDLEI